MDTATRGRSQPLVRHELNLTSAQKDALTLLAQMQDRSVNELIRQAVDEFLTEPKADERGGL